MLILLFMKARKMAKKAVLELENSTKLIARKILLFLDLKISAI